MTTQKPRIIKDYDKLDASIQEQIKLAYPEGFSENLVYFNNKDGKRVSALPFETEDKYYLVRMTIAEAKEIIREDDDYDEDGVLKDDIKDEYEDKHGEYEFGDDDNEESSSSYRDDRDDDDDDDDDY